MAPAPAIRPELATGDFDQVSAMHGAVYTAEYGLDETMERDITQGLAAASAGGWPGPREGAWVAHRSGRLAGFIALSDEGQGMGRVRWFVVDPGERRTGLGRRLLDELLVAARAHGYRALVLETFSELTAAARLYRDAGFRCVRSGRERRWGREIEVQRYELELMRGAATGGAG